MLRIDGMGKTKMSSLYGEVQLDHVEILHPLELAMWRGMERRRASSFLRGRYALKQLLVSDGSFNQYAVISDSAGKPYMAAAPHVFCSISHTDEYAVAASSPEGAVGIDIERLTKRHPALLRYISTQDEIDAMSEHFDRDILLVALWTIKEAAAKADSTVFPLRNYRIYVRDMIIVERGSHTWKCTLQVLPFHVCAVAIAV